MGQDRGFVMTQSRAQVKEKLGLSYRNFKARGAGRKRDHQVLQVHVQVKGKTGLGYPGRQGQVNRLGQGLRSILDGPRSVFGGNMREFHELSL